MLQFQHDGMVQCFAGILDGVYFVSQWSVWYAGFPVDSLSGDSL
jgi:hypothetical protein